MAGDWIKIEKATATKPEVLAMSDALDIDPDACFGKLIRVWSWFDDNTTDGNATGNGLRVTETLLDRLVGVTGFGSAMAAVGWLEQTDTGLQMPHFDYHTSESAKQRALTAKRVAKHKKQKASHSNGTSVTCGVTSALPREEKRREEKKDINTCVTLSHDHEELDRSDDVPLEPVVAKPKQPYSDDFERFWEIYPPYRRRDKGNAWKAWQKALKSVTAEELIEKAEEYADSPVGRGEFSKLPASWLNARGWEDDPTAWGSAPEHRPRIPTLEELANYNPNG